MKQMKKLIGTAGLIACLTQSISADALKNSLSGMLHQKDQTPSMVNLNSLGLSNQAAPTPPRSRSSRAVVAIVDGQKIRKKEADRYLKERTHGKIKDFDLLPKPQRRALIEEMVIPRLLAKGAEEGLTDQEKEAVLSSAWMQKKASEMKISEEEIASAYERIKAQAKAKSALAQVPPLDAIKNRIKQQLVEQKIISDLMRGAEVRVEPSSDTIAGYVGMLALSIDDVNEALNIMTKGRMTWDTLPVQERKRVLEMVAPNKLIAMAAKNGLTKKEQETALSNYWMQKNLSGIDVSEKEIKKRYAKIKKISKKSLPPLSKLEGSLKMQIAQEKFVHRLTKKAHIKLK